MIRILVHGSRVCKLESKVLLVLVGACFTYMYRHAYLHTYIHTYYHTYIHAYIHTYYMCTDYMYTYYLYTYYMFTCIQLCDLEGGLDPVPCALRLWKPRGAGLSAGRSRKISDEE